MGIYFMSKKTTNNGILGPKALEMVMRDVLSGMEEFAVMAAHEVTDESFKIIAIRPLGQWCSNDDIYEQPETPDSSKKLAEVIIFDEYLKTVKKIKGGSD